MALYEFSWGLMLDTVERVVCAAAAGIILGFPFRARPGGLRTHALVAVGTALFCILGTALAARYNADITRVIQGIIQGIGFVGAAAVIRQGSFVVGVNTAASILVASAVGCFIGTGHPATGILIAPLVTGINVVLKHLERWAEGERGGQRPSPPEEPKT